MSKKEYEYKKNREDHVKKFLAAEMEGISWERILYSFKQVCKNGERFRLVTSF